MAHSRENVAQVLLFELDDRQVDQQENGGKMTASRQSREAITTPAATITVPIYRGLRT